MLDQETKGQLKSVFQGLDQEVVLKVFQSTHPAQEELMSLLEGLCETSTKIQIAQTVETRHAPHFEIKIGEEDTGVSFSGVPGGHEFTSLVLAILNGCGGGKLPDQGVINRMKSLEGPLEIRTFISLSCENCPDVVQAMNLIAIFNQKVTHTMVDGEHFQQEIEDLKIQGVPTVVANGEVLSVGKSNLAQLLEKLEERFGTKEAEATDLGIYDVVVVGGGPAGVSAAIYSARKGLKTVVITENIGGQVKDTLGIENLIGVTYTEGPQLAAQLASHMADYPIEILEHRRVESVMEGDLRTLELNSKETLQAKSLIVTTGARWRELGIPGEKDYLGRGVGFCPHCDGPFFKGKDVAVIGGGNSGVEAAIDLAGIVKSVTLLEFLPELKADEVLVKKLKSLSNVEVITSAAAKEIAGNGDKVNGLVYDDRESGEEKTVSLDGVFVQIGLMPNSGFIQDVVETTSYGEIVIDEHCRTSKKGIYAAGDVTTTPFKQIVISMGEGAKAALAAFQDRMLEAS